MKYTKVYAKHDIYAKLKKDGNQRFKYIIHEGSSRSSKTTSIIQWIDDQCTFNPNTRATVWRDTRTSLGGTVWSDFKKYLGHKHQFGKQTNPIHYDNGSTFEPHGADFTNAHGLTQNIAWLNEPYKITKETFDAIDQRADLIIIDWNPKQGHWIDELKKHPRSIVIHSTFKDNPFCPEEQRLKILSYDPNNPENVINKTDDLYNWQVYGLGIKSEKPNKIYHDWTKITIEQYNEIDEPEYYGLDFGMVSPSGMAGVKYRDGKLFIREIWYEPVPRTSSYSDLFEKYNINKDSYTIADSAEPQEIRNINANGFRCIGANKKKGSVHNGIKNLQTVEVYYVGDNIGKEFDSYEWEIDRYGLPTDNPIKRDDHILDAIRYVYYWLKLYLNIK